ncbi:ABC transporter permease [Nocardia transvalensis]|uniref:ABC transporter permease n=1 Tax=Nocardia transvalensis TaxID=37333 RepID=UPI0018940B3D|nr:ABC transporter permease [Nocardia transvalensis]MBF6328605.1 ABC transporter permease [Nocardia transvalensis]
MTEMEIINQGAPEPAASGRRKLVWRRFLRNKPAVIAVFVLIALALAAYVLPDFLPYTYLDTDPPKYLQPPSPQHPFGTDQNAADVLALTLRGMQKSLLIGFCVAILSTIVAALAGSVAGLLGGWTDRAIMWVVDLLLVVPSFIMLMLFAPRTKGSGSILLLILLLAGFGWMISARVVRGLTLSLREREFLRAAKYMGASTWRTIITHVVPNVASYLIIDTALAVGAAIMAETSLSFLGFGIQPPEVSLGTLIQFGAGQATAFPWTFLPAGGVLIAIVLCANLIGDGLRDAFDPSSARARGRRKKKSAQDGSAADAAGKAAV